jgi:steroid delta-isomerase-like uncharacterized protein
MIRVANRQPARTMAPEVARSCTLSDCAVFRGQEVSSVPSADNKAIVRRWIEEVWGKRALDAIDDLFAADYAVNGQVIGPEGVRQGVAWLRTTFHDASIRVDDLIAEGDKVVMRWTLEGTHRGAFMGVAPTGKQVRLTGINIYRVVDKRILENHESVDVFGMLRQLGMAVAPAEATN